MKSKTNLSKKKFPFKLNVLTKAEALQIRGGDDEEENIKYPE